MSHDIPGTLVFIVLLLWELIMNMVKNIECQIKVECYIEKNMVMQSFCTQDHGWWCHQIEQPAFMVSITLLFVITIKISLWSLLQNKKKMFYYISNLYQGQMFWALPAILPSGKCHKASLMTSHKLFNGLVLSGSKPLPESKLIKFYDIIRLQWV